MFDLPVVSALQRLDRFLKFWRLVGESLKVLRQVMPPTKGHSTARHYALSGLVHCSVCGRRMQGTFAHATARYRCRFPSEYALANKVEHPLTVYVKESSIVPRLDAWLAELFDQPNLDAACAALAIAQELDDTAEARAEAARRKIGDCDKRLAKYRQTLDAGADPVVIAAWVRQVQDERLLAERDLGAVSREGKLTKEEIRRLVLQLRDIASVLATADPRLKQEVYAELGVRVSYDPHRRVIRVSAGPCTERVGGGTRNFAPRPLILDSGWSALERTA